MQIRTRALVALTAALVVAPTLAACGGGGSGDKTTISYFSWNNEKAMTPIVEAFEKANPDVHVDMSTAQGQANDYAQTLTTRIAGGQVPDVFHMSIETRSAVMDGGYAKDLTTEPFMQGLDPTSSDLYTRDGKVYGMAPTAWAGVIVYNQELLAKVGYDEVPSTWDDFITMGRKLAGGGITPYMEDPSVVSGSFGPMLGGYYAQQGDEQADNEIFEGKKTFEQVWTPLIQQWERLVTEGVMPKNVVGVNADQIKQSFMTGQLAMFRSGPWDFPDLNQAGVKFAAAPYPALPGGEPYIGGGPDSPYVISSNIDGSKLAAAQKFLSFMNSAEGLKLLEQNVNGISTSANYDSEVPPQLQSIYTDYLKTGKYYWVNWSKGGTVMGQEIASQWQLLIQGKESPEEVAQALDDKWKSL